MNKYKDIDQYFRDNLVEHKGAYDPKYWDEAEKMLDDYDASRGFFYRFRKYFIGLLVLLVAAGVTFFTLPFNKENEIGANQNSGNSTIEQRAEVSASTNSSQDGRDPKEDRNQVADQRHSDIVNSTSSKDDQVELKNNVDAQDADRKRNEREKSSNNDAEDYADWEINESSNSDSAGMADKESRRKKRNAAVAGSSLAASRENGKSAQSINTDAATTTNTNTLSAADNGQAENTLYSDITWNEMNMLSPQVEVEEGSLISPNEVDPDNYRETPYPISGFRMYAGGGLTSGHEGEDVKSENNYSAFAGLGYEKMFMPRLSVELRAFLSMRNAFGLKHQYTELEYDFGYTEVDVVTTYQSLLYLEIPILCHYAVSERVVLGGGLQYGALIGSRYERTETSSASKSALNSSVNRGYERPSYFRNSDIAVVLNLQYRLTEKVNVGVLGQYGMTDVNNADLYSESLRNSQLRLHVSYFLFNK